MVQVVYEDNHLIVVNKLSGEIVQGDKTGDVTLIDSVKHYIKTKYNKPGNVFLGLVHRLDRPVGGLVIFARTSKALSRLNDMFRNGEIDKTYWAVTENKPPQNEGTLEGWIYRNEKQNKSYLSHRERPNSKHAVLNYRLLTSSDRYFLIEVKLLTGRHHQIRCQLSDIGCPIKGDLKYGARRSNTDGSISLIARKIEFIHPVSRQHLSLEAPLPDSPLWKFFSCAVRR